MAYLFLLLKALHLFFAFAWMAGLLYLPRLFAYHAGCPPDDAIGRKRFTTMETRLYRRIMGPAMMLNVLCGLGLLARYGGGLWIVAKLALVAGLVGYHVWCGRQIRLLRDGCGLAERRYRLLNEVPAVALAAIVLLAVFRPF